MLLDYWKVASEAPGLDLILNFHRKRLAYDISVPYIAGGQKYATVPDTSLSNSFS